MFMIHLLNTRLRYRRRYRIACYFRVIFWEKR